MTKEERRIYMEEYRKNNRDRIKELNKKSYDKNKVERNAEKRKYYKDNKEELKEKHKEYKEKNRSNYLSYQKQYRENNKEKIKTLQQQYYKSNSEKVKLKSKQYRENNLDSRNEYCKKYNILRRKTDDLFKLKSTIRSLLYRCFKQKSYIKNDRAEQILGCSFENFKQHIESKWEPWMTWENYGKYKKNTYNVGWDIDHIIPTSSAKTEEDLYNLNHYTNLQPLCSKVNRDEKKNN